MINKEVRNRIDVWSKNMFEELDLASLKLKDEDVTLIVKSISVVTILNISFNEISEVGAAVIAENLKNLIALNISNNYVGSNGAIAIAENLEELIKLDISDNNILDLGARTIAQKLTNLRELNISSNTIGDSGVSLIGINLNKLLIFSCALNYVSHIGATEIANNLKQLTKLNLSYNFIGDIGVKALSENMVLLKDLKVSRNRIEYDGAEMIANSLNQLKVLDITLNQITDFGVQKIVTELPLLQHLKASQNNTKTIPAEFLNNIKSLRGYFSPSTKLVESTVIKMILLGNTSTGKTSLAQKLSTGKVRAHKSTHGIKLWKWSLKNKKAVIEVNIFDFGGQDYYHATHNLFLSDKSLFVIVWHPNLVDDSIDQSQFFSKNYWLGNIDYILQTNISEGYEKKETRDFAIWLLQNKADIKDLTKELPSEEIANLYPYDREGIFFLSIENKNKTEKWEKVWDYFYYSLTEKIFELAGKTKITQVTANIRAYWLPEVKKKFILSLDEFYSQAAERFNIKDLDILYNALDYLSKCGDLVWFKEDKILKDYIFTDPESFSNHIYKILSANIKALNQGEFNKPHVIYVLADIEKNDRVLLADLMIRVLEFGELIFKKPGGNIYGEDIYVAPQYLPENPHESYLKEIIQVSLVINFEHYIPFGRISTFITRYLKDKPNSILWKYGAIFDEGDCHCMISIDSQGIEIKETSKKYFERSQRVYIYIQSKINSFESNARKFKATLLKEYFYFFSVINIPRKTEVGENLFDNNNNNNPIEKGNSYIKQISLSNNNIDFFEINELLDAITQSQSKVKNTSGDYRLIPATFYHLLDKTKMLPKKIFFSYSHKDSQYRSELDAHFAALKRSSLIETWYDLQIDAGDEWDFKIMSELKNADVILLLLSADFMNSSYIWEKEIPLAIKEGKKVIPIFLRPCDFNIAGYKPLNEKGDFNIANIQGAPFDNSGQGIPWIISSHWLYRDEAYLKVIEKIKDVLNQD